MIRSILAIGSGFAAIGALLGALVLAQPGSPDGLEAQKRPAFTVDEARGYRPEVHLARGHPPFIREARGYRPFIREARGHRPFIREARGNRPFIREARGFSGVRDA